MKRPRGGDTYLYIYIWRERGERDAMETFCLGGLLDLENVLFAFRSFSNGCIENICSSHHIVPQNSLVFRFSEEVKHFTL